MKLSSLEEYGLRCLLQLARKGSAMTISEIGQLEGFSTAHAAKILRELRKGGFIRSVRGHAGGYLLARSPDEMSVAEILSFLGGRIYDPSFCSRHSGKEELCSHSTDCSVRALLHALQDVVDGLLARIRLSDLLQTEDQLGTRIQKQPPRPVQLR